MSERDEGERLISELWRELAQEEAPPPGLETKLAAQARASSRTRRFGWLGWSTAGFAVAGLAIYVMGDPQQGSDRPSSPSKPPAMEAQKGDSAPRARAAPKAEAPPPVRQSPQLRGQAKKRSGPAPASKGATNRAIAEAPKAAEDRAPEVEEEAPAADATGIGALGGRSAMEADEAAPAPPVGRTAPSAGRASPATAPNPELVSALARMMAAPVDAQREAWRRARRLVGNEVDRAEWMWAEVGLLEREGDHALARRRLKALMELGTPDQRARAREALSD